MYVQNLKVENFRSIKKADLTFQKGINIISGVPGQGKSSLIEAIQLLLLNKSKTTLKEIPNIFSGKQTFFAETLLLHEDNKFNIKGKLSGSLNRELIINDDPESLLDNTDSVIELKKRFKFDLIEASAFSFQNDNQITTITPAKRREVLKNIFNLNFKESLEKIEIDLKELKEDMEHLNIDIEVLRKKEYNIKDKLDLPHSQQEQENYEEELQHVQKKIDTLQKEIDSFNEKKEKKEKLEQTINTTQKNLDNLIENITPLTVEIQELKNKLDITDFDSEWKKKQSEYDNTDWSTEIDNLEREYDEIILQRIKKFDDSKIEDLLSEKHKLENEISSTQIKKELADSGKCDKCGSTLDKAYHVDVETTLILLKSRLEGIKKDIENLRTEKKLNEKRIEENINLKSKKETLKTTIDNKKSNIKIKKESILTKIEQLKESSLTKKEHIETLIESKKETLKAKESQKESYEDNIKQKEEELHSINLPEIKPIISLSKLSQKTNLNTKISEYNNIIIRNEEIKKTNKEVKEQKKKDKKRLKELEKEYEILTNRQKMIKSSKETFSVIFPNFVIQYMIRSVEKNMNMFMIEAYNGRYKINIKETAKSIKILYGSNNQFMDVSNASGFESSLLKLAWLVGLMKLSNIKFLVLDEIDSAAPVEYSEKLYSLIGDYSQVIDQIIVITHKREIREFLKNNYNAKEFLVDNGKVTEI